MPLIKGAKAKTKKGFSENIRREIESGKPQNQAVAEAYSLKRQAQKIILEANKKRGSAKK